MNVGGGLGRPARDDERPSTSTRTRRSSRRQLDRYGVTVAFEPGDWIMKDAGLLLGEVVTVERRGDVTFVGLDLGWNVDLARRSSTATRRRSSRSATRSARGRRW